MKEWLKKNDVLAKALAILISIVLWFYVVTVVDPMGELTVSKIAPTYVGEEQISNTHNLSVNEENQKPISLRLTGTRRALAMLNTDDIKVEVDISKIDKPGTHQLSYKVVLPTTAVSVAGKTPSLLDVKIDRFVTATVPINVVFEGSIAEGYIAGDAATVPSSLSVRGNAEEINSISYAQVKISKKNLNTSVNEEMSYSYFDEKGNELDLKSIKTDNHTVNVMLPVLKTKKIPLSIDIVEGGGALEKNVNYEVVPSEITIAGEESEIEAMNSLVLGVVDLSKVANNTTLDFKLMLPDGIKNVSGESNANVQISISGLSTKNVTTKRFEITNPPSGYKIEFLTTSLSVILRGNATDLSKVVPQKVRAVVDLSSTVLSPGLHTVTAHIFVDDIPNVGAVGEYKINVKVSK